jgi:hypoxanthine phosphoribosyltransferase
MPQPPDYAANVAEVLLTEQQIREKVAELAAAISADYAGQRLFVVGVLNGAIVFTADLLRNLTIPAELDFIGVASYGDCTESSGECEFTKDVDQALGERQVLVVEDIVDTGRTVAAIVECLKAKGAASVKVCALLDKPSRREVDFQPDYTGFAIPDKFVVGYGLDFAQHYRGLPYVAVLKPEAYRPKAMCNPGHGCAPVVGSTS